MKIEMGTTAERGGASGPALLDVEELLATRLLVQGNSGSGKSHLLRRLLEQSAPFVQQAIIDPEGDFVSLADKFGHVVIDADRGEAELETIAARVREHRVSCVLNLEKLDAELQMKAAAVFLNALFDADREFWFPMLVVVDEAQLFAPAASGDVSEDARKVSLGAMTNLMCRGRKRGLAGIIATQCLAKLAKNVAAEASNFLMGRTFLDIDMARAADLLGLDRRQAEMFRDLGRGNFVALGPALYRKPLPIQVGSVQTHARGSTPKLTPPPVPPAEEARDLILAPVPVAARAVVERRPPPQPQPTMNDLLAQVVASRPPEESAPVDGAPEVTQEDRNKAISIIVAEIMAEPEAAFRPEPVLYQDFLVRCRIKRIGGLPPKLQEFKRHLNVARAGLDPSLTDNPEWQKAMEISAGIVEDMQGVFLLLARAAMEGSPCPSNLEVARVCGSTTAGRAKSRIQYLEDRGYVVSRNDMRGKRIITLPDLGWETAAGDPNAPLPA